MCDLVLCWCVLHTPDLTPPDMTGYTLDSTAGALPHHEKFTLPRLGTYSHTWVFPSVLVCNIYSRLCHDYGFMTNGWRTVIPFLIPWRCERKLKIFYANMNYIKDGKIEYPFNLICLVGIVKSFFRKIYYWDILILKICWCPTSMCFSWVNNPLFWNPLYVYLYIKTGKYIAYQA